MSSSTEPERVACTRCSARILPETAQRYAGLCRACHQKDEAVERRKQLVANLKPEEDPPPGSLSREAALQAADELVSAWNADAVRAQVAPAVIHQLPGRARYDAARHTWVVTYALHAPSQPGGVVDGHSFVYVDAATGQAKFLRY